MTKNKHSLTFGVFYRSSSSAPVELDGTYKSLLEAERKSAKLFDELTETFGWPGFCVWVEPIDNEGPSATTWSFDNTKLNLV